MKTNRDLYLALTELAEERAATQRGLEPYLRAVLTLLEPFGSQSSIELGDFLVLIRSAFNAVPTPYSPEWPCEYDSLLSGDTTFSDVRALLRRQVVDLRELAASGALESKYRDLGVQAPRGSSWYNFEPALYLECACAGALGGWEEGDDTDRTFVPGEVAVAGPDGSIDFVKATEVKAPVVEVSHLPWNVVHDFFYCGQVYE